MAHRDDEKKRLRERRAAEQAAQRARDRRNRRIQIVGVIVVLVAVAGAVIWWQANRSAVADASPGPQVSATKTATSVEIGTGGPTVDLYEDFLCPTCADLDSRLGSTLDEMVTAGDITLALHPVTFIDPTQSARAAAAFACAADTGTHSMLGYQRALLANESRDSSAARLIQIAKAVGISSTTFTSCVNGNKEAAWAAAVDGAARTAVPAATHAAFGTPAILVNGQVVDLSRTENAEDFRTAVKQLGDTDG